MRRLIWPRLDQQCPQLDANNTARQKPGCLPQAVGQTESWEKLLGRKLRGEAGRERQRKNDELKAQWGVAATVVRLSHIIYDSKSGLPPPPPAPG